MCSARGSAPTVPPRPPGCCRSRRGSRSPDRKPVARERAPGRAARMTHRSEREAMLRHGLAGVRPARSARSLRPSRLPPGPERGGRVGARRPGCARGAAHRRRQVGLLPGAGHRAGRPHRRGHPAGRVDGRSGRRGRAPRHSRGRAPRRNDPEARAEVLRRVRMPARWRCSTPRPSGWARWPGSSARSQGRRRLLAVDEAHCISEWGHDFRPSFRALRRVRWLLGEPQTIALTGSATPHVRADIARCLGLGPAAGRSPAGAGDPRQLVRPAQPPLRSGAGEGRA